MSYSSLTTMFLKCGQDVGTESGSAPVVFCAPSGHRYQSTASALH
jgi:hypothetical protein